MEAVLVAWDGGEAVDDCKGHVWRPGEDALKEISESAEPEATALRICELEPSRGEWRSFWAVYEQE